MRKSTKGIEFFNQLSLTAQIAFKDVCKNKKFADGNYYSMMHFLYKNTADAGDSPNHQRFFEELFEKSLDSLDAIEMACIKKATILSEVSNLPLMFFYESFDGSDDTDSNLISLASTLAVAFDKGNSALEFLEKEVDKSFADKEIRDNLYGVQYIDMLSDGAKQKFLDNISIPNGHSKNDFLATKFNSLHDFFFKAFIWQESKEGHNYWSNELKNAMKKNYGKD
jgi:hypothetical protein